jgi:hypothetical protein
LISAFCGLGLNPFLVAHVGDPVCDDVRLGLLLYPESALALTMISPFGLARRVVGESVLHGATDLPPGDERTSWALRWTRSKAPIEPVSGCQDPGLEGAFSRDAGTTC